MYVDTIFAFYVYILFFFDTHLYCLVGCLSMTVWKHAVLAVLYAYVLYFCICTSSAQLSMLHMERCSRNTLIKCLTLLIASVTQKSSDGTQLQTMTRKCCCTYLVQHVWVSMGPQVVQNLHTTQDDKQLYYWYICCLKDTETSYNF